MNNIVTELVITDDGTSWHPVVNIMDQLQTVDIHNNSTLHDLLLKLQKECDKSLAHRVLASKNTSGFSILFKTYSQLNEDDTESKILLLKTFCSFLNGQPDLVTEESMQMFLDNCRSDYKELSLYGVRLVKFSCIMHETHRQTFVCK